MFSSREESPSAVLFFAPEGVVKELLYSEFEALLESFTPELEWAGRDAKAVYLELSPDLKPKSAVFFKLSFDEEGWVEASWNIPLVNLARTAQQGPNLGAGPMRVATAKQCPDPRFVEMLWTPDLGPNSKILEWIQNSIAINRLGMSKQSSEDANPDAQAGAQGQLSGGVTAGMEAQLAQLLQNQMLGANGMAQTLAQLDQTKAEYEEKLKTLELQLVEKVRLYDGAKAQLIALEQTVAGKEKKLAEVREYYELKLQKTKGGESEYIRALREHYEAEASEQVAIAESEYKELLNWREVELLYRAERESQLHEEITKLRLHIAELEHTTGDDILHKLSGKGITFMTYQVGLGHIAIPADDIALYLANPVGFVAAFCNVAEAVYLDWLAHFHAPVCRAQNSDGEYCGADVMRIDSPEQYLPGASDCCEKHRNSA